MKEKGSQFAMEPNGPVFHGSTHGFKPGDKIDPTPDRIHMKGESAAFGVTNTSTAGHFANERATSPSPGEQGRLFSSVYEVGPNSRYEIHPSQQNDSQLPEENTMPIDREGFTVKRHAGFVLPSEVSTPDGYHTFQPTPKGTG